VDRPGFEPGISRDQTLVIMGAVEVGREESYIEGSIRAIREISSMAAPE
jgi:hypothetical protein